MGGKAEGGFFSKIFGSEAVEFAGLASGDIKYDEAIKNITALRKALGVESSSSSGGDSVASSATSGALFLQVQLQA